jgi:DNA polymerase
MTQPFTRILVTDFETRWSRKPQDWCPDGYTLSEMTTEEYVRSPIFKAYGVGIHEYGRTGYKGQWYSHEELPRIFSTYDWSKTAVMCQNAMFDCSILSWIYDVHPCFIFDTLSMARAVRGVEAGNSLKKLAEYFKLPPKGFAVNSSDGLWDLPKHIEKELAEYCVGSPGSDVELCEEIGRRLLTGEGFPDGIKRAPYPVKELRLIDMTIKMYTEPKLVLDAEMLGAAKVDEAAKLHNALTNADAEESTLASNDKFAELLRQYGVEPPVKISKQTGKPAFAFAKSDAHFQQLLNGDNEEVALLCDARLRVKSTQARTRAQRFIDIASRGTLPVPLNYYAAETGRWGGTQQVNLQNMKRGSFLRKSICAPKGYVLSVGDLRQVEPRVLAWLADYEDMLDTFRAGGDVYATFGAQMFNLPGMTQDSNPVERQSAKSALLGAGFQLGWAAFSAQLLVGFLGAAPLRYTKADAIQLGVTQADVEKFLDWPENLVKLSKIAHTCTDKELLIHCLAAKAIIDKYRATAAPVVDFWEFLNGRLQRSLIDGVEYNHKDVLLFRKEEIVMASGMSLKYPNLRAEKEIDEVTKKPTGKTQFIYDLGNKKQKLYPGRICNNVTQGTARIAYSEGLLRVAKRYFVAGLVHDEGIFVVPEKEAAEADVWIRQQMSQTPTWMPGIPLDSTIGHAVRYGDAK